MIKIDHLEGGEVVTSFILCPLSTLQVLYNFLRDATKDMDMKGSELDQLDAQTAQVAMLIYSGMDTKSIENMLSLPPEELNAIYETLLKLKLVDVVMVRKEVQLTRRVSDTSPTHSSHLRKTRYSTILLPINIV